MNKIKKFLPLILLTIFLSVIYFYYKKNETDFLSIQKLDKLLIAQIIFLCFLYLITEGIVLRNIVKLLDKKIEFFRSFLIMNATYFCNTFIQFSGLGYRVYYLKKFKNMKIAEILRYSIDSIVCEILIFSFVGITTILYIDFYSQKFQISIFLYFIFGVFFFSSIIYLMFLNKIFIFFKIILNRFRINIFDSFVQIFINKKKNLFFFYKNQLITFIIQYLILFLIFFLVLKKIEIENYTYLSLLITSLVDFSFLIALTPYSVGISEFITFVGTRDIPLTFAEIIILINIFRICMLLIYFIFGPIFIIINLQKKKYGM